MKNSIDPDLVLWTGDSRLGLGALMSPLSSESDSALSSSSLLVAAWIRLEIFLSLNHNLISGQFNFSPFIFCQL